MKGEYLLCVTNEILNEYAEIVEQHMGSNVSEAVLETLIALPNLLLINTYFHFHLLADEDDNKFVDCSVAANAKYLVSEDRDFNVLKQHKFPRVEVLSLAAFKQQLTDKNL